MFLFPKVLPLALSRGRRNFLLEDLTAKKYLLRRRNFFSQKKFLLEESFFRIFLRKFYSFFIFFRRRKNKKIFFFFRRNFLFEEENFLLKRKNSSRTYMFSEHQPQEPDPNLRELRLQRYWLDMSNSAGIARVASISCSSGVKFSEWAV